MSGRPELSPRQAWWLGVLGLIAAFVVMVILLGEAWRRRRQDAQLRDDSLPGCVERLGESARCERQLEQHHVECSRLTRFYPGRYSGGTSRPIPEKYLDCIVLGPDEWSERLREDRARIDRERRRSLEP